MASWNAFFSSNCYLQYIQINPLPIVLSKKLYQIYTFNRMFLKAFLSPRPVFFFGNYLEIHLLIFFRLVVKLKQLARNTLLVFVLHKAAWAASSRKPDHLLRSIFHLFYLSPYPCLRLVTWKAEERKLRRSVYCVASGACVFALPESVYSLNHLTCCTFCSDLQPIAYFIASPKGHDSAIQGTNSRVSHPGLKSPRLKASIQFNLMLLNQSCSKKFSSWTAFWQTAWSSCLVPLPASD